MILAPKAPLSILSMTILLFIHFIFSASLQHYLLRVGKCKHDSKFFLVFLSFNNHVEISTTKKPSEGSVSSATKKFVIS